MNSTIHRLISPACLIGIDCTSHVSAAGVFQLPLSGESIAKEQDFKQPDGTIIKWAEFFKSSTSGVAVGRSVIEGNLPDDTLDYTDCFVVADGSSQLVVNEKTYRVAKGDFVLLPRRLRLSGHGFHHYAHFAAANELGVGVRAKGPLILCRMHPELLKRKDFTVAGTDMYRVYYTGAGGGTIRAWQPTLPNVRSDYFTSTWSELSVIVTGTTTITRDDRNKIVLKPGDGVFIQKGSRIKVTASALRKFSVSFDQDAP